MTRRIFLSPRFFLSAAVLATIVCLITVLTHLSLKITWPFFLGAFGLAGFYSGLLGTRRFAATFTIPSIAFLILSFLFSLFSFDVVTIRFKSFVLRYWPWFFLAGGVVYALVWYFYRYRVDQEALKHTSARLKRRKESKSQRGEGL